MKTKRGRVSIKTKKKITRSSCYSINLTTLGNMDSLG